MKTWSFEERSPKSVKRDPFEAEFFTGEEEDENVYGRTDALVREAIQNCLDAREDGFAGPISVRFFLPDEDQQLAASDITFLLDGLLPHLDALANEFVNSQRIATMKMNYLVVEDFGTRGLVGDPNRTLDPPRGHGEREDFYWFWRNVGRSGKSGTDIGRWGLGKTVFPATSKINALFALTVRSTDRRKMLMGQAITKIHHIGGTEYVPEGFFCDPEKSDHLQMPFENEEMLRRFSGLFRLQRKDEPGLSLVVPFRFDRLNEAEIVKSVIVHFFMPILRGQLAVTVSGPSGDVVLNADGIEPEARKLTWTGSRKEKKHAPPPFDLARWAIDAQMQSLEALTDPAKPKVPTWGEQVFPAGALGRVRTHYQTGGRLGLRVPMSIERSDGTSAETYFDVFLERDADLTTGEDHFVREGMTISRIATLSGRRGLRALLLVEEKNLSALLGDAEGPAHTEWGTGEVRPEQSYRRWKRRVTFVRNAIAELDKILSPPPDSLSEDWLQDIFSIERRQPGGAKKRKKTRPTDPTPVPTPPISPGQPRPYSLVQANGGFRLKGVPRDTGRSAQLRLTAAYDLDGGNPYRAYSVIDFRFDEGRCAPLRLTHSGLTFVERERNTIVIAPDDEEFVLEITGFDEVRDLVVSVREEDIQQ
jgi:hypothetical protein